MLKYAGTISGVQLVLVLLTVSLPFFGARAADIPPSGQVRAGLISSSEGDETTMVANANSGASRECKQKDALFEGDTITTKPGQTVVVILDDATEIVIAPGSSFTIDKFQGGPAQTTLLGLTYGMIRSLVKKVYGAKERFEVRTPASVMGVRGTSFLVQVRGSNGDTTLHTLHGSVAMGANAEALKDKSKFVLVTAEKSAAMKVGIPKVPAPAQFKTEDLMKQLRESSPDFERLVNTASARTTLKAPPVQRAPERLVEKYVTPTVGSKFNPDGSKVGGSVTGLPALPQVGAPTVTKAPEAAKTAPVVTATQPATFTKASATKGVLTTTASKDVSVSGTVDTAVVNTAVVDTRKQTAPDGGAPTQQGGDLQPAPTPTSAPTENTIPGVTKRR